VPNSKDFEAFDAAMSKVLRADPKAVKDAMEDEKRERAEKREQKEKEK